MAAEPDWTGRVIDGRYVVESMLGSGGMGVVLAARHQFTGARVALKLLRPEVSLDADIQGRFLAEARAPTTIGHPGIVQVIDAGKMASGELYLVMELLVGQPLRVAIERRLLGPADIRRIVLELLDALGAAHARGFVHRDLKPDNVFLVAPHNTVKLLDFGIAKILAGNDISNQRTIAGAIMGTPAYMAPEQLEDSSTVDARADLWAVGIIVYEMLSGTVPFKAASLHSLMVAVATTDPEPISRKLPDAPPAFDAFFTRALARDPAHRFGSTMELAAAIGQLPLGIGSSPLPAPAHGHAQTVASIAPGSAHAGNAATHASVATGPAHHASGPAHHANLATGPAHHGHGTGATGPAHGTATGPAHHAHGTGATGPAHHAHGTGATGPAHHAHANVSTHPPAAAVQPARRTLPLVISVGVIVIAIAIATVIITRQADHPGTAAVAPGTAAVTPGSAIAPIAASGSAAVGSAGSSAKAADPWAPNDGAQPATPAVPPPPTTPAPQTPSQSLAAICTATCRNATACGLAPPDCQRECMAHAPGMDCAMKAGKSCNQISLCTWAVICNGVAPRGTGTCLSALTCQHDDCTVGDVACGCDCAARMTPSQALTLMQIDGCAVQCGGNEVCMQQRCGAQVATCFAH